METSSKESIKFGDSIRIKRIHISDLDEKSLTEFKCDNKTIDSFFKEESAQLERNVTFAFIDVDENNVIGFYSLCCNGIDILKEETDDEGNRCIYRTIEPAIEIDFFAIDERYRSIPFSSESSRYETLSQYLFLYVLDEIKNISKKAVGAKYIILYSVPQAISFYKRCKFVDFTEYMIEDGDPFVSECTAMFKKIDKW